MNDSLNFIEIAFKLFYGLLDLGLMIIWSMILFYLGTLFQKHKEALAYFNVLGTDAADHLVDANSSTGFNPSKLMSTIGTLLKIYAIAILVVEFLSIFRYMY